MHRKPGGKIRRDYGKSRPVLTDLGPNAKHTETQCITRNVHDDSKQVKAYSALAITRL